MPRCHSIYIYSQFPFVLLMSSHFHHRLRSAILCTLTFPPEAEAPFGRGDLAILEAVAGVEEGSDAHFVLVQVNGGQLAVV